jgi:glycerol kinase
MHANPGEIDRRVFLALDQGGHASRAIAFSGSGEKLVEVSRPVKTVVAGNRVELDGENLIAGLKEAAESVCLKLKEEGGFQIQKVGLATQRSNIVCWDPVSGRSLSPVLSWQDRRAPEFLNGLDPLRVHGRTGLFPNPHYGASKLAWCLGHLSEAYWSSSCCRFRQCFAHASLEYSHPLLGRAALPAF